MEINKEVLDMIRKEPTVKEELTKDAQYRKDTPVYSGFMKYFPLAIEEVARISKKGNDQHHKGEPLWWDKSKSKDEPDAEMRHLLDHAKGILYDTDGSLHLAKVAWRAMAHLERYLEQEHYEKD